MGAHIPPRIAALTGISEDDVRRAPDVQTVWSRLVAEARRVAASAGCVYAPAVAHFARFERAFLEHAHLSFPRPSAPPFPLDFLCTHEIACRLLPGLPRRGLKALAGRLGHVLGETKRAPAHVEATVLVWRELAARLAEDHGVRTLAELRAWMAATPAARRGGRDYAVQRSARLDLPDAPGVYRMLGRGGEVLYLGKATSLRRRVNGYFQKRRHDRRSMPEMLTQAFDIEVTETATPLEAALLEADEIKRHAPPYNLALRARGEGVCFAGPSLATFAARPDTAHVVGPFPHRAPLVRAAAVWELLRDGERRACGDDVWRTAVECAEAATLDAAVLGAGLETLRVRHGIGACPTLGDLAGAGARIFRAWRAAQEAQKGEEPDEPESAGDVGEAERPREPWAPRTPEETAGALEGALRRFAHLRRRAGWLVQLSESSIVWRPASSLAGAARALVIERGRVIRTADAVPGALPSPPPGWPRTRRSRLASFDGGTYDRLRVLTTELRRIVASGADVQVSLSPRQILDRDALARRLFWV